MERKSLNMLKKSSQNKKEEESKPKKNVSSEKTIANNNKIDTKTIIFTCLVIPGAAYLGKILGEAIFNACSESQS